MSKPWQEPVRKHRGDGRVRVRFVVDCIHTGLPMKAGEEILVESHWADRIERIGSGRRVSDITSSAPGAKE